MTIPEAFDLQAKAPNSHLLQYKIQIASERGGKRHQRHTCFCESIMFKHLNDSTVKSLLASLINLLAGFPPTISEAHFITQLTSSAFYLNQGFVHLNQVNCSHLLTQCSAFYLNQGFAHAYNQLKQIFHIPSGKYIIQSITQISLIRCMIVCRMFAKRMSN